MSKQAVNQYNKRQLIFDHNIHNLIIEAEDLRREHPGCGVEKMYTTLKPNFIGRDRFIDIFMDLGFRLNKKKNYKRTTYSTSVYYPNIIKGVVISAPSMIWQSDITYIEVNGVFYYAVFIIDVYTKKIVAHQVSNHMRATSNLEALNRALKENKAPMIHHSDRGGQYIYKDYVALLNANNCKISMALSSQDNAYAERINRTIKEEYLDHWKPKSFKELQRLTDKAVKHYNNERPHNNIGKISPVNFEKKWFNDTSFSKPFFTIFDNEKLLKTGQH